MLFDVPVTLQTAEPRTGQWAPSLLGAFFFYVIGYFEALSSFICTAVRQQSCYVTVSLVVAVVFVCRVCFYTPDMMKWLPL